MNLLEQTIELVLKQIEGLPQTPYQLNKKTGINITTCSQIINRTYNPTWKTLIALNEKYK